MAERTGTPTALITGASKGLGATIAQFLAGAGYNLILTARTEAKLSEIALSLDSYEVEKYCAGRGCRRCEPPPQIGASG